MGRYFHIVYVRNIFIFIFLDTQLSIITQFYTEQLCVCVCVCVYINIYNYIYAITFSVYAQALIIFIVVFIFIRSNFLECIQNAFKFTKT